GKLRDGIPIASQPLVKQIMPPPYTEYTQDVFMDIVPEVIWRWHYKRDIDNIPRGITPLCPECIQPTELRVNHQGGEKSKTGTKTQSEWLLSCPSLTHI